MARQISRSLIEVKLPRLWRSSRRFIATGMRLVNKKSGKTSHFTGGPASHKGSKCPNCKKKLTLLWDVDLNDERIPDDVREGFSPANRLPFYICWKCVAASYRILSNDRMSCFEFDVYTESLEEDETPFRNSPEELPRRKIFFERIPSTIDALLSLEDLANWNRWIDLRGRRSMIINKPSIPRGIFRSVNSGGSR